MKVGIVSDIHSNQTALEATFSDMSDVDKIVCCGDIVGYGPRPKKCLEMVKEKCSVIVQGNHDRNVESPSNYRSNNVAYKGLQHSRESLAQEEIEWLSELPKRTSYNSYLVAHSHPTDTGKYVYPRQFDRLIEYANSNGHDGVVLGHTHIQHHKEVDGVFCLNPGSVGQPRDDDTRSAYAVVDTNDNSVDLRRVSYDIGQTIERIQDEGLPRRSGSRLRSGK